MIPPAVAVFVVVADVFDYRQSLDESFEMVEVVRLSLALLFDTWSDCSPIALNQFL